MRMSILSKSLLGKYICVLLNMYSMFDIHVEIYKLMRETLYFIYLYLCCYMLELFGKICFYDCYRAKPVSRSSRVGLAILQWCSLPNAQFDHSRLCIPHSAIHNSPQIMFSCDCCDQLNCIAKFVNQRFSLYYIWFVPLLRCIYVKI